MKKTELPRPTENPWTVQQQHIPYDNPWMQIRHHDVVTPAGTEGIYGVVHFKNYAVGILPVDKDGNVYLVGQYRFPLDTYSWEIPEGGCPEGTDVLATAQRELKEEVGLTAASWTELGHIHVSNCVSDEVGYLFIATDLTEGEAAPDETEDLTVRKVPFETAYQMAMTGQITDSISVLALLKAKLWLMEGRWRF